MYGKHWIYSDTRLWHLSLCGLAILLIKIGSAYSWRWLENTAISSFSHLLLLLQASIIIEYINFRKIILVVSILLMHVQYTCTLIVPSTSFSLLLACHGSYPSFNVRYTVQCTLYNSTKHVISPCTFGTLSSVHCTTVQQYKTCYQSLHDQINLVESFGARYSLRSDPYSLSLILISISNVSTFQICKSMLDSLILVIPFGYDHPQDILEKLNEFISLNNELNAPRLTKQEIRSIYI